MNRFPKNGDYLRVRIVREGPDSRLYEGFVSGMHLRMAGLNETPTSNPPKHFFNVANFTRGDLEWEIVEPEGWPEPPFRVGKTMSGPGHMVAGFWTEQEAAVFIDRNLRPIDPKGVESGAYYIDNMNDGEED